MFKCLRITYTIFKAIVCLLAPDGMDGPWRRRRSLALVGMEGPWRSAGACDCYVGLDMIIDKHLEFSLEQC